MEKNNRLPDWHTRYVTFIDTMRTEPFKWGVDCGPAWAGGAVEAITGTNPVADYLGAYKTRTGALRAMRAAGFTDLKQAVTHYLGEPVAPSFGYTGDIACIKDNSAFGYSLGIVNGDRIFFRRPDGVGTLDLLEAESVFKI